jgi:hypothetical protein
MVEESSRVQKDNGSRTRYFMFAFIVVILIAQSAFLLVLPQPAVTGESQQVTLVGVPWNKTVPMFERIGGLETSPLKHLADGTTCTKLSSPTEASIGGTNMNFYLLECNGTTGYVHARQVQE